MRQTCLPPGLALGSDEEEEGAGTMMCGTETRADSTLRIELDVTLCGMWSMSNGWIIGSGRRTASR